MTYQVRYTRRAIKDLRALDKPTRIKIRAWIEQHLVDCADPRAVGNALQGGRKGHWRYRVGKYRTLAEIHDSEVYILLLTVAHRRDVYR